MNIEVYSQEALGRQRYEDFVPTRRMYGGLYLPGGYAGFLVGPPGDYHTVVCHECHMPGEDPDDAPIGGLDEWDYPGAVCDRCMRYLDTGVLVYKKGPGERMWDVI
jgi:hypothetical protein